MEMGLLVCLILLFFITQCCSEHTCLWTQLNLPTQREDTCQTLRAAHSKVLKTVEDTLRDLSSTAKLVDILVAGDIFGERCTKANVTVVTGLVDIGFLPPTEHVSVKDLGMYLYWMIIFHAVENPVIFFTEKIGVGRHMIQLRGHRPTVVVIIEKYSLWSFSSVLDQMRHIMEEEAYPKHYPNTMYPEYAAVTHAKIEFMEIASHANIFNTDSAAWVDIGLFRDAVQKNDLEPFSIQRLPDMDPKKLALNLLRKQKPEYRSHRAIIRKSISIIGGGYWLGSVEVLKTFTAEYKNYVHIMLDEGLANCEEQIMGAMFVEGTQFEPKTQVDFYDASQHRIDERWYRFGHKTRETGMNRTKERVVG